MAFLFDNALFFRTLNVVYRNMNFYAINRIDELVEDEKIKIVDETLLDEDNETLFNMNYKFPLNVNAMQTAMQLIVTDQQLFNKYHSTGIRCASTFQSKGIKPAHFSEANNLVDQFISEFNYTITVDKDTISYLAGYFA